MIEEMSRRLQGLMAGEGLEYGHRTHTYNSRVAQELAVAGDAAGVTDALHDALFRAYFVEGLNLAAPEVLYRVAQAAGLGEASAKAVIDHRQNREIVDGHWRRARGLGVTGVPTFVVDRQGLVGAQPYETLQEFMAQVGIAPRPGDDHSRP